MGGENERELIEDTPSFVLPKMWNHRSFFETGQNR